MSRWRRPRRAHRSTATNSATAGLIPRSLLPTTRHTHTPLPAEHSTHTHTAHCRSIDGSQIDELARAERNGFKALPLVSPRDLHTHVSSPLPYLLLLPLSDRHACTCVVGCLRRMTVASQPHCERAPLLTAIAVCECSRCQFDSIRSLHLDCTLVVAVRSFLLDVARSAAAAAVVRSRAAAVEPDQPDAAVSRSVAVSWPVAGAIPHHVRVNHSGDERSVAARVAAARSRHHSVRSGGSGIRLVGRLAQRQRQQ